MASAACARRSTAALALMVLGLACSSCAGAQAQAHRHRDSVSSAGSGQGAAAAASTLPQGAHSQSRAASARRQLLADGGRNCGPGQQPDRHGRPHPCPLGTAKNKRGAYPCRRCRGAIRGRERYQGQKGAISCALCPVGGHVNAARTKCIPPLNPPVKKHIDLQLTRLSSGTIAVGASVKYSVVVSVDINKNGAPDVGEPGLAKATVHCAATDSSGTTSKSLPAVTPKSGQVEVTFQPGGGASGIAGTVVVLCLATPADQTRYDIEWAASQYLVRAGLGATIPFVPTPVISASIVVSPATVPSNSPSNITGQLYIDFNGDGIQAPNEPVIAGAEVFCQVRNAGGFIIAQGLATTDASTADYLIQIPNTQNNAIGTQNLTCTPQTNAIQAAALTAFGFDVLPPGAPPSPPRPQTNFPPPTPAQRAALTLAQLSTATIRATLTLQDDASNVIVNQPINVTGQTYIDVNGDGIRQPSDPLIPFIEVSCISQAPDGRLYDFPSFAYDQFSDSSANFVIQIIAEENTVVSGPQQKKFFLNCTTATFIETVSTQVGYTISPPGK